MNVIKKVSVTPLPLSFGLCNRPDNHQGSSTVVSGHYSCPLGPYTILLDIATVEQLIIVISVYSVMLSVHLFGGLPLSRTPSTEPSNSPTVPPECDKYSPILFDSLSKLVYLCWDPLSTGRAHTFAELWVVSLKLHLELPRIFFSQLRSKDHI